MTAGAETNPTAVARERQISMHRLAIFAVATLIVVSPVHAQEPAARQQIAQERAELPNGVPANREGHGVPPPVVIEEMKAAGFTYVQTVDDWPPGKKGEAPFLTLFTKN